MSNTGNSFISGFTTRITVACFFSPPPLTTGVCHHAVVPRRRRDADAGAVVRRAGSLSRGGNLHAGIGPPSAPSRSVSVCCVLLPVLLALVSVIPVRRQK